MYNKTARGLVVLLTYCIKQLVVFTDCNNKGNTFKDMLVDLQGRYSVSILI